MYIDQEDDLDPITGEIAALRPIEGFDLVVTIEKDLEERTELRDGLRAVIQGYLITSTAIHGNPPISATITQEVEDTRLSLFQFGIFYSGAELELEPGPDMTFQGRIHSNKDIYLDCGDSIEGLKIDLYLDPSILPLDLDLLDPYQPSSSTSLTSGGEIIKGSMPGDPTDEGGLVQIKVKVGQDHYHPMELDGQPFDSRWSDPDTDQNWNEQRDNFWGGKVRDHYPDDPLHIALLPDEFEDIEIIRPGDEINPLYSDELQEFPILKQARLYWQADLRILDGTAYRRSPDEFGDVVKTQQEKTGSKTQGLDYWDPYYYPPEGSDYSGIGIPDDWGTNTGYSGEKVSPVVTKTGAFYNRREDEWITVVEIDIAKLMRREMLVKAGPLAGGIDGDPCLENGIIYVSQSVPEGGTYNKAVRLVNGVKLPSGGLTVATDNPLYIQGNYNTENKQPAAVLCDALNILSNDWKDSSDYHRIASDTTVNVSMATGIVPTEGPDDLDYRRPNYSGGVENLPRFLENWTGKTFEYSGSMVVLWESKQAMGPWVYGMPDYTAPLRRWAFDWDLLKVENLPPGTPQVRTLERTHWEQK